MESMSTPDVERILLATDFSRWSSGAIEYAFEMGRCFDAEVLMVHGIEPISDAAVDEEGDEDFDEFFEELVEKSRSRLEEMVDEAERMDVKARFHIEIGQRWKIILNHAESEDVDLIVMGRRGNVDQTELSLGTTSQRVFFGTNRPVLTVPNRSEQTEETQVEVID